LGGDLLVGNFGSGQIDVFNLQTGASLGALTAAGSSAPLTVPRLWALAFGNGAGAGAASTLYFTAGINGEVDGLFGSVSPGPQVPNAATVGDGNLLTGSISVVRPTSGLTVNGVVGTFHDSDTLAPASFFRATIRWGDGSFSTGTVSGGNGTFQVSGSHTYARPGAYVIGVKLSDLSPGSASALSIAVAIAPQSSSSLASLPSIPAALTGSLPQTGLTPPAVKTATGTSVLALAPKPSRVLPNQNQGSSLPRFSASSI
ncbi:MAG: hypothetical protein P4L84_34295, partial [Isosphaeraceae bacterium]|nr:hypothetical protein [Isosphaeraceae bacterium]